MKQSRTIGAKLLELFLPGKIEDVTDYLLYDIILPRIREEIPELGYNLLDMLMNPDSRGQKHSNKIRRDRDKSYLDYTKKSKGFYFENPTVKTRGEGEDLLDIMSDLISTYGNVTVKEVVDVLNLPSVFRGEDYGWEDIRRAEIRPYKGRFIVDLPRPKLL